MRKFNLLFLLIPAVCGATSYTWSAGANGNWNVSTNWTPAGVPGFGDTAAIVQYTAEIPTSTTANIGTAGSTAITLGNGTLGGGLIVAGTLDLRGTISLDGPACFGSIANPLSITLSTGALLELDENGGSSASGAVIAFGSQPCVVVNMGSPGDVCIWGTASPTCPTNVTSINNGSANGVLLLDSGNGQGSTTTAWNGFGIANCGSASVPCYQPEMWLNAPVSWTWGQGVLNSDSWFGPLVSFNIGSDADPVTIDSVVSIGTRLMPTDIFFGGECSHGTYGAFNSSTPAGSNLISSACRGARSITNSFLADMRPDGVNNDPFTAGATIQNVFFDGLRSGVGYYAAANIAGGSWNNVVIYNPDAENVKAYAAILAPVASYVYAFSSGYAGETIDAMLPSNKTWGTNVSLSHFIADDQDHTAGSHCINIGNPGGTAENGYNVFISYATVTRDSVNGLGGCTFMSWSAGCPLSPTFSVTHSTLPTGINGISSWFFCDGAQLAAGGTVVGAWEGNILYDQTVRNYAVSFPNVLAGEPANMFSPAGIDYNDNYNMLAFTSGAASAYNACASNACTNIGSPYGVPITGSAPGAHDVTTNPAFLDNTRNSYSWALLHGQTANAAGFRQVFINGGPYAIGANIAALFYYIDQGNIPAKSLWNAMPDGTTIGPSQPVMFPRDMRTVTR